MMPSPNLIKPEIDDDEYANACPNIFTQMLGRFSFPELHHEERYSADGLFFATAPSRRFYMREQFRGEFDFSDSDEDFQNRPKLWVLVSQFAPGHHFILPVWRGRAFWRESDSDTDEGVLRILFNMAQQSGLNLSEWYSFISDQRARMNIKSRKRSKRPMVN